jgi:ribosomal protein L40E
MGKFPIADAEIAKIWICKRCKARNHAGSEKCRKCGCRYLRPKKKTLRAKKSAA